MTARLMAQAVPRIGLLAPGDRGEDVEGFMAGMRELGYVDGRNLVIVYRSASGRNELLEPLFAEFVSLKVSVIVTGGTAAARVARHVLVLLERDGLLHLLEALALLHRRRHVDSRQFLD